MVKQEKHDAVHEYETPTIVDYGTVRELTERNCKSHFSDVPCGAGPPINFS
jgi:hypothetical protein